MCLDIGVVPITYMTVISESTFTSKALFAENLDQFCQMNKAAGTAAHNQNAIAKRAIHIITSSAHSMPIHAAVHWPTMAVAHAVLFLQNHVPNSTTGLYLEDLFTGGRFPLD
jgi:hypothetical protein